MTKFNYLSFPELDLKEILKSSQANKLVLFIGSGFSKFCETEFIKIPDWSELINELKEELNLPKENDFLKIAQLYFLKHGQHSYTNKIKSTIKNLEPSIFHKNLFNLSPHYIITTNWDDLLEKTAQDTGLAYDLISSDIDLAQSQLDKKIIKMHGDFRQHNFVFKEDDYLQYSQNFPLIENYIKGIFSTSTIVFLGYSYSDYDLKQIVSWVSNISKATPRKYLLQLSFDDAQAHYLKNHGISLLTPSNPSDSFYDLYLDFFNDLRTIQDKDELTKKILISSELEIRRINDDTNISPASKSKIIKVICNSLENKIKSNLDSKFLALSQYKVLLPEQISKKFTNSTIDYNTPNETKLILHEELLTGDYDKHQREMNRIAFDNILNVDGKFKKNFFTMLDKSFITTIEHGSKAYKLNKSQCISNNSIYSKISFRYSKDSIEVRFINEEYNEILEYLISKVKYFIKEENYILATINMANFDIIHTLIKQQASATLGDSNEIAKKTIENYSKFDYKNKIIDFPRELHKDLQDLIGILEFNEIYRAYYRFNIESQKNIGYAQERKKGGLSFSTDEFSLRPKLYTYIYFILGNEVFIEEFREIRNLFESSIINSLEHYFIDDKFHINIMDSFILIKYCDTKIIHSFSRRLLTDNKILNINILKTKEILRLKKYFILVLDNLCELFNMRSKKTTYTTSLDRWLNNTLTLMSLINWSNNEIKDLIVKIIYFMNHHISNTSIHDKIRDILITHDRLYQKSHPDIIKILDITLDKISKNKLNGYDTQIIGLNMLDYIFFLSNKHGYIYENNREIVSLLISIQEKSEGFKKFITNGLLLKIKEITTNEIKEIIDEFIAKYILTLPCSTHMDFMERLTLTLYGYPISDGFLIDLKNWILDNIPQNISSLDFIKAEVKTKLPLYLETLIKEKNKSEFQSILDVFNERMKMI
ncbi:SIR2 family protein [Yersinia enterocolitica]|uniref:SIR2 family protein n=1 Tax=Yersinia enterocolitica TaxID=630 RepID=UPI002AC7AB74|nr:hypothetical protein [Yersinia enterocolitica]HEN3349466.1 SIR2 family protein [Yersinia enterocolitica]